MRISDFVAQLFSAILHPLLMPLYSILLLFVYTTFFDAYAGQELLFFVPVFIFCTLTPGIFVVLLKSLKIVSDYSLTNRAERHLPYMMAIFSNGMLMYFFYTRATYFWFLGLAAIPLLVLFVGFLINLFWKISLHMLAMGALVGGMMSVCFNVKGLNPFVLFVLLFMLAGFLGVSRLFLGKNTAKQVYIGFIIGFILAFASVYCGTIVNNIGHIL